METVPSMWWDELSTGKITQNSSQTSILYLILHSWEWEVEHLHTDNAEDVINCRISIDLWELLIHWSEELLCKSVS